MTEKTIITQLVKEKPPRDAYLDQIIEEREADYGRCMSRIWTIERHEEHGVVTFPKERVALYFYKGAVIVERTPGVTPATWTVVKDITDRSPIYPRPMTTSPTADKPTFGLTPMPEPES